MPGFAARAASLAEEAGLTKTCFHWSEFAGAEADLPSMRRLVSSSAASPTLETWTWIYLSLFMGEGVRASTMKAYH